MDATRWWTRREDASGTLDLARDATLRLPRCRGGVRVRVEQGTVLVTQAGDPEDHVLVAGATVDLPEGGLAVAWALSAARVEVSGAEARLAGGHHAGERAVPAAGPAAHRAEGAAAA
jgi:hypothetical protein